MPDGDKIPPLPKSYEAITNTPPLPKGYIDLKKKDGSSDNGTNGIGGFSTQQSDIQKPTGLISNEQVNAANQQLQSAKNSSTEQKQVAEYGEKVHKAQADKLYTAAKNTLHRLYGKNIPSDSTKEVNDLMNGVGNGSLGITQDAKGNDVIKNSGNFFQSFKAAADQSYAQDIENKYLRSIPKDEAISYLNRIADKPETGIVKEMDIAPTGVGKAIGEQSQLLGKATIGGMAGAETGLTGGASAGSFLSIANDLANSGYSQALKKNYYELKKQGLSDSDAFDKATHAALTGEAVNLGTGILLTGELPMGKMSGEVSAKDAIKTMEDARSFDVAAPKKTPTPTVSTDGFLNSFKHTIKSSPKVLGSTAAGSVINDIQTNAISNGNPIDAKKMLDDAEESTKPMAVMHFGLGALSAIANGQKTIVPSYVRPQIENIVASGDRSQVENYYRQQESDGTIPQGTTEKVLNKLSEFDQQKKAVENMPISEEQKAAITGKLIQRKNLQDQKELLSKYGSSFNNQIEGIDKKINTVEQEINEIHKGTDLSKVETDNITGETILPIKPFDKLNKEQVSGIEVPKDYGETNVEQVGEGEEKKFIPKAFVIETKGGLKPRTEIEVTDKKFSDKNDAQAAADKALAQHYYENELPNSLKPKYEKVQTETLPASENNEAGNSSNGYKQTSEESQTEKGVGEVVQPQQEKSLNDKSDADLENRQNELEDLMGKQRDFDKSIPLQNEFNAIDKELEKREKESVFNSPLEKVNDAVDAIMKKEKERPNGYGSYMEVRDASETRQVAERYLSAHELSDNEIKKDFTDAAMGRPETWTADGLQLRESLKEASKRGINIEDLLAAVEKKYTQDGYDEETAKKMVAYHLKPIFKDAKPSEIPKEIKQLPIIENKPTSKPIPPNSVVEDTNPKTNSVVEDNPETGNISQPLNTEQESKVAASNDEGDVSGVKKAITQPLRSGLNLPKVELPKMGGDVGNLEKAKVRVDKGESNPLDLVDRILKDKNGFRNEDEVFDMQYYGHQLKQQEGNLKAKYAEAETETEKASVSGQIQQLSDEVDRFTEASQTALNKWGKIGNAAQVVVDEGFNPSREKLFIKDAYGGEIPKDVQLKIDAVTKERDVALTALKEVEEKLKKAQAEKALVKFKKAVGKNKEDIAKLKDEAEQLKQQLRQAFKKDLGNINAGIPIPKETLEVLGKLAINYLKQGALTVDAIASKIYDDLKDEIKEPFTKKDVRDWLTNAANITGDVETARLNRKAQNIEDKVTPTILDKEGKPREQKPIIPPKSQIKAFQNSSEWVKANQRVINAEYKMKVLKRQAFESQKNWYQKGLMWFGRLTRLSVLSGYNVLYKLAAASTIGGALKRIPEQAFGGVYSQIFKGISEKAPIEGSLNALSEAKFYKEFFNPKKFVHNTWEILKTGESDLSKKFSTGKYEHVKGLYLPTDLHQIIKDPLKRGTFESSFRNALIHAEKNGLDINDPLIINSIESAAFKRANYEIFQEQNALTKKFTAWKNQMEKSGNIGATGKFLADFLVPVSTVPTNIVRRLVTTSPIGLIRGGIKVVEAYRKGVESLSNEQADAVMRQLKQGSFGTALWLVGWFGYPHFGGLYSKYDPDKKRREGELASDEMEVDGNMIPAPVQHALPFEIIQWAATARRIHENYTDKKDANEFTSIYNAGLGSIGALIEQIPIIEETGHLIGAASEPYEANKLKDDVERRFEPQILRETGVIPKETKPIKSSKTNKTQVRQTPKRQVIQHR